MSHRVRKPNQEEWPALLPRTSKGFLMFCHVFLAPHREERAVCSWEAQDTFSQTSKQCGAVIAVRIHYLMLCMKVPLDQNWSPWKVIFFTSIYLLNTSSGDSSPSVFWSSPRYHLPEMGKQKVWGKRSMQTLWLQCTQVTALLHSFFNFCS